MRELRRALTILLKTPSSTATAVVALALGIGVNVACFIPISALIIHPLPYREPNRLVALWGSPIHSGQRNGISAGDFGDLQQQTRSFAELAAYERTGLIVDGGSVPDRVPAGLISPRFFAVLGMAPALGHSLHLERGSVAVSNAFWKTHLGSSSAVIGSGLLIEGKKYTIAAVMPDSFDFPLSAQIWKPFDWSPEEANDRDRLDVSVIGLLRGGVSEQAAASECTRIASQLALTYPKTNAGRVFEIASLRAFVMNDLTNRFVLTLLGASLFVFLLACANVGNLQLAKAAQRHKEVALRAALGASRMQIARTFLLENSLVAVAAALLGLLLASWKNDHTLATLPVAAFRHVPGLRTMHIDGTVIALTFALSLMAGLVCSVLALLYTLRNIGRIDLADSLRDRSGAQHGGSGRTRVRSFLIVMEVALALILLVGAGLMVQTFSALLHRDQGFDPHNLLNAQLSLPPRVPEIAFYRDMLQKLESDPRVQAAGIASEDGYVDSLQIQGEPALPASAVHPAFSSISPGYLRALRIPIVAGRDFSDFDRADSQKTVIVSRSLAARYWPHQNAIGQRMGVNLDGKFDWLTVVGISGDVVYDWFHGTPAAQIYVPYTQRPMGWAEVDVRTRTAPLQVLPSLRAAVENSSRQVAVYEAATMEQLNLDDRSGLYYAASGMTEYAVIALLLSLTGIYSVVALFINARTQEIGVRIALGAKPWDVLSLAMSQMLRLIGIALACGIPAAILLSRGMSHVLDGVVPISALMIAPLALALAVCALLASYLPARRATGIDPAIALREQ